MTEPIVFSALARAFWGWISSPSTVILLSLVWLAYTLARIAARASETDGKDN